MALDGRIPIGYPMSFYATEDYLISAEATPATPRRLALQAVTRTRELLQNPQGAGSVNFIQTSCQEGGDRTVIGSSSHLKAQSLPEPV
ncbi:MAG: hypothetical protein M1818_006826 [Claussenomyces sp. TS43310]|nr:MAG: hypothetical protein M1818_006826 [Claussenomyces sp. TS43310]